MPTSRLITAVRGAIVPLLAGLGLLVAGCTQVEIPPHLRPLSKDSMMLLGKKGMEQNQPIFVRIFKEESELEVWKQRADGHFYLFKTYPICAWSGTLGPKLQQGDRQAPEGFYRVARTQMNPNSQFFLSFNLGYPNAFDKAHGRTGDALMVHGKCVSAGCYAMTDALMEEIYALAREAFIGGQEHIHVHAFPFRMTEANMQRHKDNTWYPFWRTLKEGYDHFEYARRTPEVAVCARRYHVNVAMPPNLRLEPDGACPRFERPTVTAFTPLPVPSQNPSQTRLAGDGTASTSGLRPSQASGPIDAATRSGLTKAR